MKKPEIRLPVIEKDRSKKVIDDSIDLNNVYMVDLMDEHMHQVAVQKIQAYQDDMADEQKPGRSKKILTRYERNLLKLQEMKDKKLDEDRIDEYLKEQIQFSYLMTKRQELNNVIVRFTNFKKSMTLVINFKELDLIKDEEILGIRSQDKLEEDQTSKNDIIFKSQNYFNNMSNFWDEFLEQTKKCENTMKDMDMKILKMYLIERMLPEYNAITHDNVINSIMSQIYFEKLKKSANRTFLKWVKT